METDVMGIYKESLIDKGFMVGIGSEYCKIWKSKNETCFGCESEDGCNRLCTLGIVTLTQASYKPTNYQDFQTMEKDIRNKITKILNPETTKEEIRTIV